MGIKKCSIYLWIREYENIGSLALMSVKDMTPDERAYVMGKRCIYGYPDVPSAVLLRILDRINKEALKEDSSSSPLKTA